MILLGIDIGLTGAIGAIGPDGTARVVDMPTRVDGKTRRVDGRALIMALRQLAPAAEPCLVVYEDVRPRPMGNRGAHGNSMHSQGSLMASRGAIEAVLDITGWRCKAVQPQAWKRHFGLIGKDKKASSELAREMFPDAAPNLKRVKDHNRADAILLAKFGAKFT